MRVSCMCLLRVCAKADASVCASISRALLQRWSCAADFATPGRESAIAWDIMATHAQTSPEATAALHEHAFALIGVASR